MISIAEKVAAIMSELPSVEKSDVSMTTAKGKRFTYKAYDANLVFGAVRPLMAKHGLVCFVSDESADGNYICYDIMWMAADTGDTMLMKIVQPLIGQNMGVSQQFNAADTLAIKRAIRRMFLITDETESDEQRIADYDKPRNAPKRQQSPNVAVDNAKRHANRRGNSKKINVNLMRTDSDAEGTHGIGFIEGTQSQVRVDMGRGGISMLAEMLSVDVKDINAGYLIEASNPDGLLLSCWQRPDGTCTINPEQPNFYAR